MSTSWSPSRSIVPMRGAPSPAVGGGRGGDEDRASAAVVAGLGARPPATADAMAVGEAGAGPGVAGKVLPALVRGLGHGDPGTRRSQEGYRGIRGCCKGFLG